MSSNSHKYSKPFNVCAAPYSKSGTGYIRLRWTVSTNNRKELLVPTTLPDFANIVTLLKLQIMSDWKCGRYDESLQKYKQIITGVNAAVEKVSYQATVSEPASLPVLVVKPERDKKKHKVTEWFTDFMKYRHQIETQATYYYACRQMVLRWEKEQPGFDIDKVPDLLLNENYSSRTYNERRGLLITFFNWCIAKKKLAENPLSMTYSMSCKKGGNPARKPFTVEELQNILYAIKTNRFVPKYSAYTHSQYYHFVYFMALTGVRNAEAVGLQCKKVNFVTGYITIDEAFARSRTSSNASARKMKETKNGKTRYLPMSEDLRELMMEACTDKAPNDYVFVGHNMLPIDDKAFQRRVWKKVIKELKIAPRDLYALRHTFATRAVQAGLKPQEVADLMGDRLDTVIENYYHSDYKAAVLPTIIPKQNLSAA